MSGLNVSLNGLFVDLFKKVNKILKKYIDLLKSCFIMGITNGA